MNIRTFRADLGSVLIGGIIGEEYPKIRRLDFVIPINSSVIFNSAEVVGFKFGNGDNVPMIQLQNTPLIYTMDCYNIAFNDYYDVRNGMQITVSGVASYIIAYFD